jgi:AcrR family transcriptional regulator
MPPNVPETKSFRFGYPGGVSKKTLEQPADARIPAGPRGRARDAARDRALQEAALTVLEESGYGGLTTAAVAKRAGVSTATLYRRWRSKEDLVVGTTIAWAQDLAPDQDTGTLEGDLRALLRDKAETCDGPGGRLLWALVGEAAHNTVLAGALTTAFILPAQARINALVRRAVGRGEIPPIEDPRLVGDLVIGPMLSRAFLTRGTSGTDLAADMVEQLLPFLLRALGARPG